VAEPIPELDLIPIDVEELHAGVGARPRPRRPRSCAWRRARRQCSCTRTSWRRRCSTGCGLAWS